MPMLTELQCAIMFDVLLRVSLVLTAGLLLALTIRRNAALRHSILVAGLAAAFMVPAAMLSMHWLPVSRWLLDVPGRGDLNDLTAISRDRLRAPTNRITARRASNTRPPRSFPREKMTLDRVLPPMSLRRWTSGPSSLGN